MYRQESRSSSTAGPLQPMTGEETLRVNEKALLAIPALVASGSAWIVYLRWKDRHRPEPLGAMLGALLAGGVGVGAAFAGYRLFDALGAEASWSALAGPLPVALPVALAIGAAEEGAKLLPVVALAVWSRHFDELLDGAIYAGASAIGFSLAETATFVWLGEPLSGELLARVTAAPIAHVLFAVPAGLGLAAWQLRGRGAALALGLAASVVAHGAYDLLLARVATPLPAAGLVLALWIAFLGLARRLEPEAPPAPA